jgi:hypothetical protein
MKTGTKRSISMSQQARRIAAENTRLAGLNRSTIEKLRGTAAEAPNTTSRKGTRDRVRPGYPTGEPVRGPSSQTTIAPHLKNGSIVPIRENNGAQTSFGFKER